MGRPNHELRAEHLQKIIKKTVIIKDFSLHVSSGEVVGLLGPNGAGKTTTFYMICGLIDVTNGNIYLDDQDISNLPFHERARNGIGYLPQESSIFKDLSVEDNIMMAAEVAYGNREEAMNKTDELLQLLNIEPIRRRKGIHLSGGERRRCEIARALAITPKFLLLDEPFAGVDPIAVEDIQKIINDLKMMDIGVLITDHNVRETLSICDRAYVIKDGMLLASGTAKEVSENKDVKTYYLGANFKL